MDSGLGSSSMQSWSDSRTSNVQSPTTTKPLAVIDERSNFAFSPVFTSQESSRDSLNLQSPATPQTRRIAVRTQQHCSPSPSLPFHIQALVRGKPSLSSPTTSPKSVLSKKGKQSLFKAAIDGAGKLSRSTSLKRVATSENLDFNLSNSCSKLQKFATSNGSIEKLASIHEASSESKHLTHSCSTSAISCFASVKPTTPLNIVESSVTVTTNSPASAVASTNVHQAPPETCMVGDGSRPYLLPCKPHESTVLITPAVLVDVLKGQYSGNINKYHIIDCRYPYEHEGGHIKSAKNHPKAEPLLHEFFGDNVKNERDTEHKRTLLIFHCEFSSKRAPDMVKAFRKCDRHRNRDNYPRLDYPEVYMLQGGYKAFYEHCKATDQLELLEPFGSYTPMHAEEHNHELRRWKKYKTMSSVEDRLITSCISSVSPLSSNSSNIDNSMTKKDSSIHRGLEPNSRRLV